MSKNHVPTMVANRQDSDSNLLISDRVEHALRQEIGKLQGKVGAMLPRQEELVARYGVSLRSVREAIERLKKDKLIRSIRGKGMFIVDRPRKLRDVLLICDEKYFPFQVASMGVISNLLKKHECTSSLVMSHAPAADWQEIIKQHPDACGVILISRFPREVVLELTRESPVPVVTISDLDEPIRRPVVCDTVLPDTEILTYHAVEHLARQGHRKIAFLGWELTKASGCEALHGYRNALSVFGVEYQPDYVMDLTTVPTDLQEMNAPAVQAQEVRRRYNLWVERNDLPTALVHYSASESKIRDLLEHGMGNHFHADAIIACLYLEQLRTGYGGLGDATAMCISIEQLARQALNLLFRDRESEAPPIRNTVEEVRLYRRKDGIWRQEPMI